MLVENIRCDRNIKKVVLTEEPVVIHVTGEIDDDMVEDFGKDIARAQNTGQPVVPIVINSNGGEVYSLLAMLSMMENSKIPIATIVPGFAASAACALFACGTEGYRYMSKNARLMMHDVSQMMCGNMTLRDMEVEKAEMKHLNRQIFKTMAVSCSQKSDYFMKLVDQKKGDLYLSAAQAKQHKLCNHVAIPVLKSQVSYSVSFGHRDEKRGAPSCTDPEDDEEEENEDDEDKDSSSEEEEEDVRRRRRCRRDSGKEKEKDKKRRK